MLEQLLYIEFDSPYLITIFWGVSILLFLILVAGAFLQRRTSIRLRNEVAELEKVRQNNIEFEFVLKAMKIAIWHMDPKARTVSYDADFRDGKDSYVSQPDTPLDLMWDYIVGSDCQRVKQALEDVFAGRTDFYHQVYRVKPGKSSYWEESYATISARDDDGNPVKIVGTSMRIDAQKEMEAALISARNKAEESDRLKTAFLANMGHEIRTPLNAIVGFADLLPMVSSDEERNQIISEIQMNNHKLLSIIDGLVSMSKVEAEAKNLVKSQTNIVPLLKEIVDTYTPIIDADHVVLATEFPYEEMLMNTDTSKLKEAVDNLMSNAVKFTSEGTILLGYNLVDGDHIRIWVKDSGKGILEADQKRIFERFVKVDEYIPGTGLGLSVAKSHAESLGGKIGVESSLGKGSLFWIELPLS